MNTEDPALLSIMVYRSAAYRTHLRFHLLETNFFVFQRNYEELRQTLVAAQSPESFSELWIQGKEQQMLLVMREVIRRLHNFVASAVTLVDHTRAMTNDWYAASPFRADYQAEVHRRFVNNAVTGFVEDLRNYALHFRLPLTTAQFEVVTDPVTSEQVASQAFVLDKAELLQWDNWSAKGKPYLEAAGPVIPVLDLVDQYHQHIRDFHDWMMSRLEELHTDELAWLGEMEARVQAALTRLRPRHEE